MKYTRRYDTLPEIRDFMRVAHDMGMANAPEGSEDDFYALFAHAYWNLRSNYTELPRLRTHCETRGGSAELVDIARAIAFWGIRHAAKEISEQDAWEDTVDALVQRFCA